VSSGLKAGSQKFSRGVPPAFKDQFSDTFIENASIIIFPVLYILLGYFCVMHLKTVRIINKKKRVLFKSLFKILDQMFNESSVIMCFAGFDTKLGISIGLNVVSFRIQNTYYQLNVVIMIVFMLVLLYFLFIESL
jgi:hypothetical protein